MGLLHCCADVAFSALGYTYSGGEVEKQDKFLKRMSGLMHLYAAIVTSPAPQGAGVPHPHGLQHAWLWLARVINYEPRPDITATLIYDLLQVAGRALLQAYGQQFVKLVQLLITDYLPKIRAAGGAGGPVARLEAFLSKILQKSNIDPPKGILPPNFFHT